MNPAPRRVAIVGASAAGLAVATGLRDEGFDGEIVLVGAEDALPYDRPPLSKKGFTGQLDSVALTDTAELAELQLDLRLGATARALDPARKTLTLEYGEEIPFDACALATGATPIRLPGPGQVLRSFEDALAIDRALERASKVIVIGAGVLGCELAALAREKRADALVVDLLDGPMLDKLGPAVSGRLEALHREKGVAFRLGTGVAEIAGDAQGGYRVVLDDGSAQDCDLVLVAVGCRPVVDWLEGSGVPLANGVRCDVYCEALPGIYAAGDVASWPSPRYGRRLRIEHRMNATEQGMAVAANILGAREAFDLIPFFWTDQYDAKIQVFGVIDGSLDSDILTENSENGGFVTSYSRNGRVEGVLGWNMARSLRKARALIGKERSAALQDFVELQGA